MAEELVDVKKLLLDTLDTYKLPIYLQGSLSDTDTYPDSFFTYWNNNTEDTAFYDNSETMTIWDFDLNFYSTDPVAVNSKLTDAKATLKAAGFIVNGAGYDVVSDEKTHTGRGINILYIQKVR